MIPSSLLPSRFRGEQSDNRPSPPSRLNRKVASIIQCVSKIAYTHPIHTICITAILASTTYVQVVKETSDATRITSRTAEWPSLAEGSRHLIAGPETSWKWNNFDVATDLPSDAEHLALATLIFPDSSPDRLVSAPSPYTVPLPSNLSVSHLPLTFNNPTAYSHESALAFSLKYSEAPEFLAAVQEIPSGPSLPADHESSAAKSGEMEQRMWIMKLARAHTKSIVSRWFHDAWAEFIYLLRSAETTDIIIMVLGYLSMHLTFISLFLSMRKLGSNVWLATSVLISSTFAFFSGLSVTTKYSVPISTVLLSEGLPFLVVTIGFEKKILFTRAVLSHAVQHRRPEETSANPAQGVIQTAVQSAIRDKGYEIVRDYVIEIGILVAGAVSGVQGGLQQFCFLAAWVLVFDCLLLFTFYTAILCIKLEVNRIKRHADIRKALEDDGVSRRVAEHVASSNDWALNGKSGENGLLFGPEARSGSVPKFKFWMVAGFLAVNTINLCTIPFRTDGVASWTGGIVATPPVDPFKIASNGLDEILLRARGLERTTAVTVLPSIKYELGFPSIYYASSSTQHGHHIGDDDNHHQPLEYGYGVGAQMVGIVSTSLENTVVLKWIIVALAMSVILNGYLFNVARWGIKDPDGQHDPTDLPGVAAAESLIGTHGTDLRSGEAREAIQPEFVSPASSDDEDEAEPRKVNVTPHSQAQLDRLLAEKRIYDMTDDEVISLSLQGKITGYGLERSLRDCSRAVRVRRSIISRTRATAEKTWFLEQSKLPYENYDWERVLGACCENVIGYMPIPVGVAGPLVIDGQSYFIPMATTEGVLVASVNRGCKAINAGGGAVTVLTSDGMTRGPCVGFDSLERAGAAKNWLDSEAGQSMMKAAFDSTSRFARLQVMKTAMAGTNLYIRFKTSTGDAMGMNMISKGVEYALNIMAAEGGFEDMMIVSLSANYCIDKKAAAINWIDGRGKGIVAEAIIPGDVVKSVLKSNVDSLVELNVSKNLIGSAMAASLGGYNAQAANIVAAVFIATGQDAAQVVESSNCITIMKNLNGNLQISVSMPSIEVGTLGGGTVLEPQSAMLDMFGVRGSHPTEPGENARRLGRIIGAAVLAGELSLCSALDAGHLVKAHMAHNRSAPATRTTTPAPRTNGATASVGLAIASSAGEKQKSATA
ncbi:hydroxymethylglutaryl-CoA reductase [Colletotrichum godetiae]|uniref:3-hydroxy-3-methylglutaryl coenzyme A reductase n=1 Tax=Colletotrichum godetiae TaxID=1209918 RepID=A0AAJ0ENY3_9PEZI|nr:hydroxymethylglutaryl-CoA reductase [Colletotrichum godetiae]KAK1658037.1 hydroxymethylglutaryl-CoA reductase [Colletotrichum godetiae]